MRWNQSSGKLLLSIIWSERQSVFPGSSKSSKLPLWVPMQYAVMTRRGNACMRVASFIVKLTPIGVFAIVAGYFALLRLTEEIRPAGVAAIAVGTARAGGVLSRLRGRNSTVRSDRLISRRVSWISPM